MAGALSLGFITLPLLLIGLASGCTKPVHQATVGDTGPAVTIQYDGKPLADCHVVLFESVDTVLEERWQGWSNQAGTASLVPMNEQSPSSSPNLKYRAALSSQGDGGWILEPRFADPKTSQIDVQFATGNSVVIELPVGAVKPL